MVNRAQRRKGDGENLYEWLKKPDMVARRGEVWSVIGSRIRLHELEKRRNRPMARFQRFINRIFRIENEQIDPETGE